MYAAEHWSDHASAVQGDVCNLACSFLLDDSLHASAACAASIMRNLRSGRWIFRTLKSSIDPAITALQYTADQDLNGIMRRLLIELNDDAAGRLNFEVSTINDYGTPLFIAALRENTEMVRLRVQDGAQDGEAVLHSAISRGDARMVRVLHDLDVSANAMNVYSQSALVNETGSGNLGILRLLLDYGVNIEFMNPAQPYGTALLAATLNNYAQIFETLLENGADIDIETLFYDDAVDAATKVGNTHTMIILVELTTTFDINERFLMLGNALCSMDTNRLSRSYLWQQPIRTSITLVASL